MAQPIFALILMICVSVGYGGSSALAQMRMELSPAASNGLTLSEAITRALAHNLDLSISRSEADISRGKLKQARRYPFNPELTVEGEFGRGTAREGPEERSLRGGRIGLSQVVEIRGQRGLRTRAAEVEIKKAEWEIRDTERQVVSETMRAFGELLTAQERQTLARETLNLAIQFKSTVDELVAAGQVPELDALRAEVERRRAASRNTLEENSALAAARALALVIGKGPDVRLKAMGPLLFEPAKGTYKDLLAFARANRPDLKAAESALDGAQASLRLVGADRILPSLTLSASYGEAVEFDSTNRLGVFGVSIPLSFFNRREGDIAAAEAEVRKAQASRDRLSARLEKEVTAAFEQLTSAKKVVEDFVSGILPIQEETVKLIFEGYRIGEFRLNDALLAQRDFFETKSAYLEAISSYNAALAEIYRATGMKP